MLNALGEPQTIVVFGGTSDIGLAIVRARCSPATHTVVLACRDTAAGERAAAELIDALDRPELTVRVEPYEADAPETHEPLVERLAAEIGDLDLVVFAVGVLGDQHQLARDPVAAASLFTVNTTSAVSTLLAVGALLRTQGHGQLVVLSSVAGERVRRANYVYGASKAGQDAFAQGLADDLAADNVRVLIVRPGFVHSSMTAGRDPAPFATTPDAVAAAVVTALPGSRRVIWVPGLLRFMFIVFRHLPGPIWRRLPLQ